MSHLTLKQIRNCAVGVPIVLHQLERTPGRPNSDGDTWVLPHELVRNRDHWSLQLLQLRACLGGWIKETGLDPLALTAGQLQAGATPQPSSFLGGALGQPLPVPRGGMLQNLRSLTNPYPTTSAEQTRRCSPIHIHTYRDIHMYLHISPQRHRICMCMCVYIGMPVYKLVLYCFIHQFQVSPILWEFPL